MKFIFRSTTWPSTSSTTGITTKYENAAKNASSPRLISLDVLVCFCYRFSILNIIIVRFIVTSHSSNFYKDKITLIFLSIQYDKIVPFATLCAFFTVIPL